LEKHKGALLVGSPVVLLLLAAIGTWRVWGYHDPAVRWTAVGAILAGVALLAAAIGLPIALTQLVAVQQDLDRLTRATDMERELQQHMVDGTNLARRMRGKLPAGSANLVDDFDNWSQRVAYLIGYSTDEVEKNMFDLAGAHQQTVHELEAKIAYVRNDLMPKVRSGYWPQPEWVTKHGGYPPMR
jgi:hypothetical protein